MNINSRKAANGFTLIEVLITLVIVAILASIAIPAYQSQIAKSRRADAQAALIGLAQAMERYNTENNTYTGATLGIGATDIYPATTPVGDDSRVFYNLSIENLTATTYRLRATPVNAQAGDGDIIYTSAGLKQWDKNNSGAIEATENCWDKTC